MMQVSESDVDLHSKIYSDSGDHGCQDCGRVFSTRQNLATHVRRFHKVEYLTCTWPGCNKQYKHRWDLTSHVKTAHKGEKVLCPHCGSQFSKKSNLHNHLTRGKGCPRARSSHSPGGRLLGRTSSDDREESSETSEIDSGIREEEIDSAGDDHIEAATEDLKAASRDATSTEAASISVDHTNRNAKSPNGQNGDEQYRNGEKNDAKQLTHRNGGKNGEEQHKNGGNSEDDSPLYKFLKENRDLLKNVGGRDPGCPESPALEPGLSDSPSLGQGSYEIESRGYPNTKDNFYAPQNVKVSSNLDLLADIALNQRSANNSPTQDVEMKEENIPIDFSRSNPLQPHPLSHTHEISPSGHLQSLPEHSDRGSPNADVLQSLQELQLLQNLQEITKAKVEKHLAAINTSQQLNADGSQQQQSQLTAKFQQSDELTKLLTASQSNGGPVPPSTMQLLSALATTQSQNIESSTNAHLSALLQQQEALRNISVITKPLASQQHILASQQPYLASQQHSLATQQPYFASQQSYLASEQPNILIMNNTSQNLVALSEANKTGLRLLAASPQASMAVTELSSAGLTRVSDVTTLVSNLSRISEGSLISLPGVGKASVASNIRLSAMSKQSSKPGIRGVSSWTSSPQGSSGSSTSTTSRSSSEASTITASRLSEINKHLMNIHPTSGSFTFSSEPQQQPENLSSLINIHGSDLQRIEGIPQPLQNPPNTNNSRIPQSLLKRPIESEIPSVSLLDHVKLLLGSPLSQADQMNSLVQLIEASRASEQTRSDSTALNTTEQSRSLSLVKTSIPNIFANTTAVSTSNGNDISNIRKDPFIQNNIDVQNLIMLSKIQAASCSTSPLGSGTALREGSSDDNVYKLASNWRDEVKSGYSCDDCGRVCSTPAHLNNHIRYVHANEKPTIPKTLQCPNCDKKFGRQSHLAEHIKTVHEGRKRKYQRATCQHCGKNFARQCSLNQHLTSCHGGGGSMDSLPNIPDNTVGM